MTPPKSSVSLVAGGCQPIGVAGEDYWSRAARVEA
jgi:hypothetical protein